MLHQRHKALGMLAAVFLVGFSVTAARGFGEAEQPGTPSGPAVPSQPAAPSQTLQDVAPGVTPQPLQTAPAIEQKPSDVQKLLDEKAKEEEKAREAAAAEREKRAMLAAQDSKRAAVLSLTHDEALANLLSTSVLDEAELAKLLAKYDFKANLEAEKMRQERQTRQLAADLEKSWISAPCKEGEFPVADLRQTGKLILGFVENKSGKDVERFRATLDLAGSDGAKDTVKSEFIDQFAAGERRRISFANPWKDKKASDLKVSECRAYRKPTL